jgi:hypothetical protein
LTVTCARASDALTVLHTFDGADGESPFGGVVMDSKGNLYGTTMMGGTYYGTNCALSCGTVFELSPASGGGWTFQVIYNFTGDADGGNPRGNLIVDNLGNIYGTTTVGGTVNSNCSVGCGTVFELSPSSAGGWVLKTLHSFDWTDGAHPSAGVIRDSAGRLYGVTSEGGLSVGNVFALAPSKGVWKFLTLYTFGSDGNSGGSYPNSGLAMDVGGNLYGTATMGGSDAAGCPSNGCGTVFELSGPLGSEKFTVLHSFEGLTYHDGAWPEGQLLIDGAGDLYGTTVAGGVACSQCNGYGTVFKLSRSSGTWREQILLRFSGTDGENPAGALAMDSAGNLYGATGGGGAYYAGTVFTLKPSGSSWQFASLYSFTGGPDGLGVSGGVILDASGDIFGTATYGGSPIIGNGTVFELSPQ